MSPTFHSYCTYFAKFSSFGLILEYVYKRRKVETGVGVIVVYRKLKRCWNCMWLLPEKLSGNCHKLVGSNRYIVCNNPTPNTCILLSLKIKMLYCRFVCGRYDEERSGRYHWPECHCPRDIEKDRGGGRDRDWIDERRHYRRKEMDWDKYCCPDWESEEMGT